jgi:hypothetical protein
MVNTNESKSEMIEEFMMEIKLFMNPMQLFIGIQEILLFVV